MRNGFTLIELMISISIVFITAALAIPLYQDYTIRAKISEGILMTSAAKTAVAEYYHAVGRFPLNNFTAGLPSADSISSSYVKSLTIINGTISVLFQNIQEIVNNQTVSFVPTASAGVIQWSCKGSGTTVPDQYLPANCR